MNSLPFSSRSTEWIKEDPLHRRLLRLWYYKRDWSRRLYTAAKIARMAQTRFRRSHENPYRATDRRHRTALII